MPNDLERQLRDLKHGDHVCPIHENAAEQTAVVVRFMTEGLQAGERCLYLGGDLTIRDRIREFAPGKVDVERALERGALQFLSERNSYLRKGAFDPRAMIEFVSQADASAIDDGFPGLRLLGNMTSVLGAKVDGDRLIEYEALLNDFLANSRSIILCHYDRTRFDPALIRDVLRMHPIAILGERVCPNLFYEPPQMVLGQLSAAEQVDWKIAQLERLRTALRTSRQSDALLRTVAEGITDALFVKDLQGRYLMINSAGARFLGKSIEEVLGKDDSELFSAETARPIMEDDRRIIASGKMDTIENVATAAGITRTYLSAKGPYRDQFGNIAGVVGIARDVTESKLIQVEHDRLVERLRLQIDRLPLAYLLTDSKFGVLDWNPAAEKTFGFKKQEALGRSCLEFIQTGPIGERLQELVRRIETGDMEAHSINDNRTKDGQIITCEWFNTPLMDSDGKFAGLISLAQDVTGRTRMEEMLEYSQRQFKAIFENALDPILLLDDSGCYVDGNPATCELLGYSREEFRKLTAWDVTPVENRGRIPELLGHLLGTGTLSGEYTLLCKGGATRLVEFRAVANILPGLHLSVQRDITERKRTEQDLRDYMARLQVLTRRMVEIQEKERGHLARELHDEIGQVLSAVSVNLQSLTGVCDVATRPRLEDSIHIVDQAIEQVRNLSLDLRPSMLDDLGLVSTLRWYTDRQAQRAGYVLHFVAGTSATGLPPDLATACYRVVQEALTNVARHARATQVWVEFRERDGTMLLFIRDNGVGFDLAAVRQRAARGASFGVVGMQERIELLSGHFEIESKPAQGTTIRVRIPVASPQVDRAEQQELVIVKPIRVLLADDHALFRAGIRSLLEKIADIEIVGEAGTGREALRLIQAQPPDVVVMDIMMPELNGLDAAARVTAKFPDVRVIILSMNAAEEYVLQALRAGAAGYLLKNVSLVELTLAIKAVAQGETFLCSAVSKHVMEAYVQRVGGQGSSVERLTPRQREVLQLVVEGNSNKEICRKLAISIKTVEMHRTQLMAALNIHDVPGLVRYAIRVGLISPDA